MHDLIMETCWPEAVNDPRTQNSSQDEQKLILGLPDLGTPLHFFFAYLSRLIAAVSSLRYFVTPVPAPKMPGFLSFSSLFS